MTPAQHKTAAETILTRLDTLPTTVTRAELDVADVHAHLARAAGTGSHYVSAEAQLASAEARYTPIATASARLHALLAD